MERREKILAIVAGSLAVLVLGFYLIRGAYDSVKQAAADVKNAQRKLDDLEYKESELFNMQEDIRDWADISLPSDVSVAANTYLPWLRSQAIFENQEVKPVGKEKSVLLGKYKVLTYSITGQGDLSDLTDFLYNFYSTDLLHRITKLSISPAVSQRASSSGYNEELRLDITVEALSLENAFAEDDLIIAKRTDYPARPDFEKIVQDAILDRNLFNYNMAPRISELRQQFVGPNDDEISFSIRADDPEDRPLTYSLEGAPDGMRINSSTGVVTYRPRDRDEPATYENITAYVDDVGMKSRRVSTVFSVSVAPAAPAPEPPADEPFDVTRYTYLTSIRDDGAGPSVWIDNRPQGEVLVAREDETVKIGGIDFTIVGIDFEHEQVTILAADKERVLALGDNLSGFGTPLRTSIRPTSDRSGFGQRGGFGTNGFGGFGNRGGFGQRGGGSGDSNSGGQGDSGARGRTRGGSRGRGRGGE